MINVNERNDTGAFFTFTCNDGKKFIEIFEGKLMKKLLAELENNQ